MLTVDFVAIYIDVNVHVYSCVNYSYVYYETQNTVKGAGTSHPHMVAKETKLQNY